MPKRNENQLPQPKQAKNSLVIYVGKNRISFGRWDDLAAWKKYAEWCEQHHNGTENLPAPDSLNGGVSASTVTFNTACNVLPNGDNFPTVADLVAAYLPYAKEYKDSDWYNIRTACKTLLRYANYTTAEFDACMLLEIRDKLWKVDDYKRVTCNRYVRIIISVFQWGEPRRLVPPGKSGQLRAVEPLPPGTARESDMRQDVSFDMVEKTLPYLLPIYQSFLRILMETGARPSEILRMKVGDIERKPTQNGGVKCESAPQNGGVNTEIWVYQPKNHKTAKKNKRRIFIFGAKEQFILAPYMAKKDPNSVIFSPKNAILEHYKMVRSKKTTLVCKRQQQRDKQQKRHPHARITNQFRTHTIGSAIRKAITKANQNLPPDQQIPYWTLYQIRHGFATIATLKLGEEAAALLLGHSNTTQLRQRYDHSEQQRITEFKKRMDSDDENTTPAK